MFSRQVDVISSELQSSLASLRVGVVGLGGTGSATIAQLARLGVGEFVLVDPDQIERSNVNRVHGAALRDVGLEKRQVSEDFVRSVGLGATVRSIYGNVADEMTAKTVGTCDLVFGCTDDELGRSILSRLAYACLTPVFDMAVKIDPHEGMIRNVDGRVTTLLPNEACLECRERITGEGIRADSLRKYSPEQAEVLERDGYIGRADLNAPAVVTFTTAIASYALNELLHRLMGLYGESRKSSEILVRFLDRQVRTNRKLKRDGCYCYRDDFIGSGDKRPFLGLMWQS
jgi:molybdopterin/thiamine biosynthesis adenylyltransferase